MKSTFVFILGGVIGWWAGRKLLTVQNTITDKYISLDNIRRGIKYNWYEVTLKRDGNDYLAHLVGMKTDGTMSDDYYPITEDTFITLKEEGITEE